MLAKADLDDLRGEWAEHTLILQKGADIALLIPDEAILVGSSALVKARVQLLKTSRGPDCFDHRVFSKDFYLYKSIYLS